MVIVLLYKGCRTILWRQPYWLLCLSPAHLPNAKGDPGRTTEICWRAYSSSRGCPTHSRSWREAGRTAEACTDGEWTVCLELCQGHYFLWLGSPALRVASILKCSTQPASYYFCSPPAFLFSTLFLSLLLWTELSVSPSNLFLPGDA